MRPLPTLPTKRRGIGVVQPSRLLTRVFRVFPPASRFRVDTAATNRYGVFAHFGMEGFQVLITRASQLSGQRLRRTQGARGVGAGQPEPSGARPSMNASAPPPPNCLTRRNAGRTATGRATRRSLRVGSAGAERWVRASAPIGASLADQKHTTSRALPPRGSDGGPNGEPRRHRVAGSTRACHRSNGPPLGRPEFCRWSETGSSTPVENHLIQLENK